MWTYRLVLTTFINGIIGMSGACYMTLLTSLDKFVKPFANRTLSSRFQRALSDEEIGKWHA
jgi:hypothetical protein